MSNSTEIETLKELVFKLQQQRDAKTIELDAYKNTAIERHNAVIEKLIKDHATSIYKYETKIEILVSKLHEETAKRVQCQDQVRKLTQSLEQLQFDFDARDQIIDSLVKERDEHKSADFDLIKSLNAKNDELTTDLEITRFSLREYHREFKATQQQNELHYQKCNEQQKQINEQQKVIELMTELIKTKF